MIYPIFYFATWLPLSSTYQPILKWTGLAGKYSFQIIPTNFFENIYNYLYEIISFPSIYRKIGIDAKNTSDILSKRKNLLVVVIGETARGMNFELNGYNRETNFYTKKQNVISFRHFSSCGTCTRVSVPCIFHHLIKIIFLTYLLIIKIIY